MFETGVSKYVKGIATVENFFPVDDKGVAHLSCTHCRFYLRRNNECALNKELCHFPDHNLGDKCPLHFPD